MVGSCFQPAYPSVEALHCSGVVGIGSCGGDTGGLTLALSIGSLVDF